MEWLAVAAAMTVGALVKAVTGMGLPPVAIPVMAQFLGVQDAVVIMAIPTLVTNAMLSVRYRDARSESSHLPVLMATGVVGAVGGAWLLTTLDDRWLAVILAAAVLGYVVVRLRNPHFVLPIRVSRPAAPLVGLGGGALQGATGLSGPVLATYLHALRLSREAFVFSVTLLFQVFALGQIGGLVAFGRFTPRLLGLSVLATVLATLVLAAGAPFADRVSRRAFDRLVMAVLVLSAVKLLIDAV